MLLNHFVLFPHISIRGSEETSNQLTCDTCHKDFRTAKALESHISNAHPDAVTKAYHCAQCNTSFRFKEAMETHMVNKSLLFYILHYHMFIKLKFTYLKENVHGGGAGEGGSGDKDGGDEKNLDEMEEGEEAELNEEELGEGEEDDDEDDLDDEELQGNIPDYDPAIDGHCCTLCGAVFSAKKRLVQHLKVCCGF